MEEMSVRGKLELASPIPPQFARFWHPVLHLILVTAILCPLMGGAAGQTSLTVGAIYAMNTTIGEVVSLSLQLAVQDVNSNASILPNHTLQLDVVDSSCDAFQGAAAAVELLRGDVTAVVGPQTSLVAQFAADLGAATRVPFVSFAATDPSLTAEANNPYFLRTVHSDALQMKALAALVGLYGWREVSAISTNDYVGLNSLEALSDALCLLGVTINYKNSISPDISSVELVSVLNSLAMQESRVIIVHLQLSLGRLLFKNAESLEMMTSGYVWLMSEAMSSLLENLPTSDPIWSSIQGALAVRSYVPPSPQLESFQSRWTSQQPESSALSLNIYGMYAYDTLWLIARSMDAFLQSGKNFTFTPRASLPLKSGGGSDMSKLQILADGELFLQTIQASRFVGVSGPVQLDTSGDVVGSIYEILNLIGKSPRVVGFWNRDQGFSPSYSSYAKPENGSTAPYSKVSTQNPPQLQDIIWPGGSAQVPKGWAVAKNGQKLSIGVPLKRGFQEFVSVQTVGNVTTFHGYCIDVFEAAVGYLPYPLNYTYVAFGNGTSTPSYDDLVEGIVDKTFDAVVGDVTITTKRSKIVDFTQPYTASGLVVVVPTKAGGSSHAWAFMRPFTPLMWCTTGAFFLFTGLTIWILEHKKNKDFRGRPKKQIVTVLWFIFSTLFFSQREKTKSTLGRAVLILWLFVVLIIISSYTASLTSILTVQQLMPTVQGIAGLVTSNLNIGYQSGSFVEDYLLQMSVPQSRLVPLENQTSFASALKGGSVGAIVDELPYIQLFLANECGFTIAGQEFTKSGWGFAFPKGSQLAVDMSTAILQLAEDGHLQQIHDYWLSAQNCGASSGLTVDSNELGLSTFWGLFLITGVASICCVVLYYARLVWQHHKAYVDEDSDSDREMSRSSRHKSFLRSLVSFIEESEVNAREQQHAGNANNTSRKNSKRTRRATDFGSQQREAEPPDQNAGITSEHETSIY